MNAKTLKGTRVIALIGPYRSGKTSLIESFLSVSNTIPKKGSVTDNTASGDKSEEARRHQMGVELNLCQLQYEGEEFVFLDCPGSLEFLQQSYNALMVADAAIVVCEPQAEKSLALTPYLKFLDDRKIPHFIYINKMDVEPPSIHTVFQNLQDISTRPLILRELPIREGRTVVGYVDLVSEKAYKYDPNQPSKLIKIPSHLEENEKAARHKMLESLSEYDDHLLEELIEDIEPREEEIHETFIKDLQQDLVVPVVFGSALLDHGTRRLLNIINHEVSGVDISRTRVFGQNELKDFDDTNVIAEVFHTQHIPYKGKLSYCRIWNSILQVGMSLSGEVAKSMFTLVGTDIKPQNEGMPAGSVVILNKFDAAQTGHIISSQPRQDFKSHLYVLPSLFALAVETEKRTDELKLNEALAKLTQEDPSLIVEHNQDTGDLILHGQGDIHLKIAMERLQDKFNVKINSHQMHVPYKESIQGTAKVQGRHKKQSGGHGQFGDVHLEIKPLERGKGFEFFDQITGGAIPKNYIPAVQAGVEEALEKGIFGYPVVDVSVNLFDGSYHRVDSSDLAFKMAAIHGIREALPKCEPYLLEPIMTVEILVPTDIISAAQKLVSGHRGKILGFSDKEGWNFWSTISSQIPQAELHNFINELRSLSAGLGAFESRFDHFEAVPAKMTEQIAQERKQQLEKK